MPPRPNKRRRGGRHTNVFVQESAPAGREELMAADEDGPVDATEEKGAAVAGSAQAVSVSRARRLRAQRVAGHARARSEVFTRTIGKELRKLGILTGGIAVILVVLTFVL